MNKERIEKFIKKILDQYVNDISIFNDEAPKSSNFPYMVLNSSSFYGNYSNRLDMTLTIDIWDKKPNYKSVNGYADKIVNCLDFNTYHDDNMIGSFYLNVRNKVPDDDKTIKRINLIFNVNVYFREEVE